MTIDQLLTFEQARKSIGELLEVDALGKRRFPYSGEPRLDVEEGCSIEFDPERYRLRWVFNKDSNYVAAIRKMVGLMKMFSPEELKRYVSKARRTGSYNEEFKPNSLARTGFQMVAEHYQRQMNDGDETKPGGILMETTPDKDSWMSLHIAPSTTEGLMNAIEHGSDFCHAGEVALSFYGGQQGALYTVESPKPFDFAGYIKTKTPAFKYQLTTGFIRGRGFNAFHSLQGAAVNGENVQGGFRLILLYQQKNQLKMEQPLKAQTS